MPDFLEPAQRAITGPAFSLSSLSRFPPPVDPRFSYPGENVIAALEGAYRKAGYPETIRIDQSSELISRDLNLWAYQRGLEQHFSRPGKPTDKAFI